MTVFTVSIEGVGQGPTHNTIEGVLEDIREHLSEGFPNDDIRVHTHEMTEAQLDAMPEFEGY